MSWKVEADAATTAARHFVEGLAALVAWIVDVDSGAQILGVSSTEFSDWLHGNAELPNWLGEGVHLQLTDDARDLAEYAWNGTWHADESSLDEAIARFMVISELLDRTPVSPAGNELLPAEARQTLERVIHAVLGRQALDDASGELTIEQVAALARVSEKTVRMAANPSQPQALRTKKAGHRTQVASIDALEWLSRRRDFNRTRLYSTGPGQPTVLDSESLALACQRWSANLQVSADALAKDLEWSEKQRAAYDAIAAGTPGDVLATFPPSALRALAERLGMPEPATFSSQAYRVLALAHAAALTDGYRAGA